MRRRGGKADPARSRRKHGEKRVKKREVCKGAYREETPLSPREQQKGKREQRGTSESGRTRRRKEEVGFSNPSIL